MGSVPVFELKQQIVTKEYMQVKLVNGPEVIIVDYPGTDNYGSIYAASYGRGLFRADNYFLVGTDENKIDEIADRELVVYPNPVSTTTTVEIEINSNIKTDIYVFDLHGRQILKQSRQLSKGVNKVNIDMSGLRAGAYIVQAVSGNDVRTKKIIVN